MCKKNCFKKLLLLLLLLVTVISATAIASSAHSDVKAEQDDHSSHSALSGCGDCASCTEDGTWATLPAAAASNSSGGKNPNNYPYPNRNLIYNGGATTQTGDDVKWLQSVLVHLGYSLAVDGSYGPETRDTIKKFQKKYGLEVDGMSGPITRPKLKAVWEQTGHTWNSGTVTKNPAVGVAGRKTYSCIYCEATKNVVIAPLSGPTIPAQKQYLIGDNIFNKNIDDYLKSLNSSEYDPTFANMMAALCLAKYNEQDIANAYNTLGFTEHFESTNYSVFDPMLCGYTIAFKDAEYGNDKICLITFRGSISATDWIYDFDTSTYHEGKHTGFWKPAELMFLNIRCYLLGTNFNADNVKYVITGHSRGGAVANLLSVELMEHGVKASNIYNYNFACPDVAYKRSIPEYNNIFNLSNTEDAVPYVPGILFAGNPFTGEKWVKYGKTIKFTAFPKKTGFFASHKMELYLSFFNERLTPSRFPYDQNSNDSGLIAKIFCPVDAVIINANGDHVASITNGEINYYDADFGDVIILKSGDKKFIYVNDDSKFDIKLIATDTGTMTYTLERCNLSTGEISETKTFNNVALEAGKTMYSPISEVDDVSDAELFVFEEKDGKKTYTHSIGVDGVEEALPRNLWEKIKNIPEKTKMIIAGVVGGIILLSLLDSLCGRSKKKKKRKNDKQNQN